MQINFFAGASLAKAVVPNMVTNGSGKIIWISSVQGLVGIPSRTSYAASKFAVQGYCESLRAELASSGIAVHVVSPGYIRTNLSKSALAGDGTAHGKMDETTAKGKPPKEVAVSLLNGVAKGKGDIVVAATLSAKVAIWLRFLFPKLLQKILVKRFEKSRKAEAEEAARQKVD
jgi:dehydrogenase/reductase SDR family protein 7B